MSMPTLNIKDPEVYRMAKELAARRHTSATGAVREALKEALARETPDDREARFQRIMAISERSAARPQPVLTDADLYDERGLPK